MKITATIKNKGDQNQVIVTTNGNQQEINIPSKNNGRGSSVNGGELLFLSLATCFCNDVYREANLKGIDIKSVEVNVSGSFGLPGQVASDVVYDVKIISDNTREQVDDLILHVDRIAEIHNTVRKGIGITIQLKEFN